MTQKYLIGITGCSSSGKTALCHKFFKNFGKKSIIINQDSFYKTASGNIEDYNFDIPNSIDFELFENVLKDIKSNKETINIPTYDYKTHKRIGFKNVNIKDTKIFIIDGIFLYYYQHIRKLFDIKFFVDTDLDICLSRRIKRDITERGSTIDMVMNRYEKFVKPSYIKYIQPIKQYANIIIPFGSDNYPFLDMFCNLLTDCKNN